MKNRILPTGLLTAIAGVSLLLFTTLSAAASTGSDETGGKSRWDRIRANQVTGTVNPADVEKALQQIGDLRMKSTSALDLQWESMGPDNFAGPVWSVVYDNTDATGQRIYAGSANGGIWVSTNGALTWSQAATAGNIVPKVSSLVQTSSGAIYAATGSTTCGVYTSKGTGLYVSTGGQPFALVPGTALDPDWITCAKLAAGPNGRLYAATEGGLLYSDNGTDWTKALAGYASDVTVGPDGTVLATVAYKGYLAVGGDMGNLVEITTGTATTLPADGIGWLVFAISPSDGNVMYASIAKTDGTMKGIYRSGDKGATWSLIFPPNATFEPFGGKGCSANTLVVYPNDPNRILLGGVNMWEGTMVQTVGYFSWEQVSFGDTDIFNSQYLPSSHHAYAFNPKNALSFAVASDGGVSIGTTNSAGITYQTSNKNLQISRFNSVCGSYRIDYIMGGADKIGTQNIGYFFPAFVNSPHDGFPVWLSTGAADEGGTGGSCEWSVIDPNIIIYSKVRPVSPELPVRRQDMRDITYVNDFLMGINNTMVDIIPMRLWESFTFTLNRDSVKFINKTDVEIPAGSAITAKSKNIGFPFQYTTPVTIMAGDSIMVPDYVASRFFIAGTRSSATGLYMTKDALTFAKDPSYFMVMKDNLATPSTDPMSCVALSADGNTAWVGTEKGRLIRVSNLALAHDSATADLNSPTCIVSNDFYAGLPFAGQFVSSIAIDPNNPAKMLVTLGNYGNTNYLYYTTNALDSLPTFTSVQGNLPQIPVFSSIIEMHSGGNAVIGTDFGIFSTQDLTSGNPTWTSDGVNMGDVTVTELRQQVLADYHISNLGMIYAASYGRGLWRDLSKLIVGIDPGQGNTGAANGTLQISPNPASDAVRVTFTTENSNNCSIQLFDLTGRMITSRNLGNFTPGTHTTTLDLNGLPSGNYLVRVGNAYGKLIKR